MARPKRPAAAPHPKPAPPAAASTGRLAFQGERQRSAGKPPRRRMSVAAPAAEAPRGPLTVPTRWLKAVVGVLLLPVCWVAGRTFFEEFARATIHGHFWASTEFYHFALGALIWILAFFLLPKMVVVYVFGHELTHALWVLAQGGTVSAFKVGRSGGYIIADRRDFLVSLAPYFFPLYSIIAIVVFDGAGLFWPEIWLYRKYLFMAVGLTWAFHFSFTCWMIPKQQSDLLLHGTFFSLVIIYLANLLVLTVLFVIACPQVTWAGLGEHFVRNAADFSQWLCDLIGLRPEHLRRYLRH